MACDIRYNARISAGPVHGWTGGKLFPLVRSNKWKQIPGQITPLSDAPPIDHGYLKNQFLSPTRRFLFLPIGMLLHHLEPPEFRTRVSGPFDRPGKG